MTDSLSFRVDPVHVVLHALFFGRPDSSDHFVWTGDKLRVYLQKTYSSHRGLYTKSKVNRYLGLLRSVRVRVGSEDRCLLSGPSTYFPDQEAAFVYSKQYLYDPLMREVYDFVKPKRSLLQEAAVEITADLERINNDLVKVFGR